MSIQKIIFTCDFFRPSRGGLFDAQRTNLLWISGLFSPFLAEATALPAFEIGALELAGSVQNVYKKTGLSVNLDSWAALYDSLPEALHDTLLDAFADSLVIGFEMPPSLLDFFSRTQTPYIDVVIHPVRFMNDLMLGFKSNVLSINQQLAGYCFSEAAARIATAPMRAYSGRFESFDFPDDTVLFIGQTSIDRSMIVGGRFLKPRDYLDRLICIIEEASSHNTIAVKLHPMEKNEAVLEVLNKTKFSVLQSNDPVYRFLSSKKIGAVVSLSSSVGEEARIFGIPSRYGIGLSTPVQYKETLGAEPGHISISDAYLSTDFWRDCLRHVTPVSEKDGIQPISQPSLLRRTLRSYWGYEQFAMEGVAVNVPDWAGTKGTEASLRWLKYIEETARSIKRRTNSLIRRS